jgi:aminoglycoside/choline kinase family phosphotransferase
LLAAASDVVTDPARRARPERDDRIRRCWIVRATLHGDASTRRYVRLHLAGAPHASAVAMVLGDGRFAPGSDELGGGTAPAELPFVNVGRWLAAHGFPVPALYADRAREDGLLLLEDIGA